MAYICDDCKYVFPSRRSSCPFCGGRVYNNTLPEQSLFNNGYSLAPCKMTKAKKQSDVTKENPYDDLRRAFFSTQTLSFSGNINPEEPPQKSEGITADDKDEPSGVDFFSQFSKKTNGGIDIPTVEPQRVHQSEAQLQNVLYEQELQELKRRQRRFDRQYRRRAVLGFIANIKWQAVFRVLFVVFLIVIAIAIWQLRYVIFNSIISFLITLLPIVLIVWILWYFFR